MSDERADQIIDEYFDQLAKALLPMPPARRSQLLDELRADVEAARDGLPVDSEASAWEVLERLGDPEEIAAEALAAPHVRRKGWTVFIPRRAALVAGAVIVLTAVVILALIIPSSTTTSSSTASGVVAPTVSVGGFPTGIAVNSGAKTVYVAAGDANALSMFDEDLCNATVTSGCSHPRTVSTGGKDPIGVVVDSTTGTLYVVNGGSNNLAVLNAHRCDATDQSGCSVPPTIIDVPGGPEFLALNPATRTLYVADTTSGTVSVLDATRCNAELTSGCARALGSVPVGGGAFPIAVDQQTNTVYVGTNQGVAVIDGRHCDGSDMSGCSKQPAMIPLSIDPAGITVDDAEHTLYVSGESGAVAVINTSSCQGRNTKQCAVGHTTLLVGADARGAALDSVASTLYVANAGSNTVSLLDTARCNVSTTSGCAVPPKSIPVGSSPRRVAIGDGSGTAYVVNVLGNNVSLLSTKSCNAVDASGCPNAHPVGTSAAGNGPGANVSVGSASSAISGEGAGSDSTCAPTTDPTTSGAAASTLPGDWPVVASGVVEGMSWSLRAASGESGANAIENGALVLDGRAYGLCPGYPNPAELELIDMGTGGVVAGVVGYPGMATVNLSQSTANTFDVGQALPSPEVQIVQGVSFFIGALPNSACDYPSIELNSTSPGVSAQHNLGFGTCVANQVVPITASQGVWQLPPGQFQNGLDGGTSTIVTAPTPTPPTLPPAGQQPTDPASAKSAVQKAFKTVYGHGPTDQKLRLLQGGADPTVIAAGNAATVSHPQIAASSVPVVLHLVFTDPKDAAVLYEIDYEGTPTVGPKIGYAILDDGTWKVTRSTFCADINNAGTGVTC